MVNEHEPFEIVLCDGEEVVVIGPVSVPVQVCPVLATLPVRQRVSAEVIRLKIFFGGGEIVRVIVRV